MEQAPQLLLIGAVAAVGVLHTVVPDHWAPIVLLARQQGWSRRETARNAGMAGAGHAASTLAIALAVWLAGAAFAERFGDLVDGVASAALILFGGWIAVSSWRELRGAGAHHAHAPGPGGHSHSHHHEVPAVLRHTHLHRHGDGVPHFHWHEHMPATAHAIASGAGGPPGHEHPHATAARTALLLILGSSPMVEGIPAFFAAGRYGVGLIAVMAAVFALATIATYVGLCIFAAAGLPRLRLGPIERFGEVLSGALIAALGVVFWIWPVL